VRRRALVVTALLLSTAACGGGSDKASEPTTSESPPVTGQFGDVNAVVRGTGRAVDGLEVEIDDNYFKPNIIEGAAGQTVTLKVQSEGKSLHNFSLAAQNISQDIPAGSSATIKVTFAASGDLQFFCKYHKAESGMAGVLRVTS
jgi:plastocyanin